MGGKASRTKGHSYERELARRFQTVMPGADVKRGLAQTRSGAEVADVECPYFWIEAKRGKKPNPRAALKQAIEANCQRVDAGEKPKVPIAVVRDDRKEAFVVIGLDDFLALVEAWWKGDPGKPEWLIKEFNR